MTELHPSLSDRFLLSPGVEVIRREQWLLLYSRADRRTVRMSPGGAPLLPLLRRGADFGQLQAALAEANPRAGDVSRRLTRFLATLVDSRVVQQEGQEGPTPAVRRTNKHPLLDLNPVARPLGRTIVRVMGPTGGITLALTLAVLTCLLVAALAVTGELPRLPELLQHLHWGGILLFVLIVAPLHEFAHAVACHLVGVEAGPAGLILHGGFFPGPYVDCDESYRIRGRWARFVIPAAGPFINLVSAGVSAAILLFAPLSADWRAVVYTLMTISLMFVFFDTNPLAPSDGSHCIEALLDDELARRRMFVRDKAAPKERSVDLYRKTSAVYFVIILAFYIAWWNFGSNW